MEVSTAGTKRPNALDRRMRGSLALSTILVVAALAGCAESPSSFHVPTGASMTAQPGATEFHTLIVNVVAERIGGAPVANADVVVHGLVPTYDILRDAPRTDAPYAFGQTDADGRFVARVAPGQFVHIAAGGLDAWTSEELASVSIGAANGTSEVTLPLYRASLPVLMEGALPPEFALEAAQSMPHGGTGRGEPLVFSTDPAIQAAYEARLARLDLQLAWDNGPLSYGDLYLGAVAGDAWATGTDASQMPMQTGNAETLEMHVDAPGAASVLIMTAKPQGAPQGLPYTVSGEASFRNRAVEVV